MSRCCRATSSLEEGRRASRSPCALYTERWRTSLPKTYPWDTSRIVCPSECYLWTTSFKTNYVTTTNIDLIYASESLKECFDEYFVRNLNASCVFFVFFLKCKLSSFEKRKSVQSFIRITFETFRLFNTAAFIIHLKWEKTHREDLQCARACKLLHNKSTVFIQSVY